MQKYAVDSSNISSIAHNPVTLDMEVEFINNTAYVYSGVPVEVFDEFRLSDSKGRFLATRIKNAYACKKVVVPTN